MHWPIPCPKVNNSTARNHSTFEVGYQANQSPLERGQTLIREDRWPLGDRNETSCVGVSTWLGRIGRGGQAWREEVTADPIP